MVWKRAAGVIVAGCLMAGCVQQRETPKAAPPPPVDPSAVAGLEQSWRETHPGSMVGHVNAVDPERHVLQVADLPLDRIHEGDVISILLGGQANSVVPAKVYDKRDGYVQMDYGPLQPGQSNPREGDLAIWFSEGLTANEQAEATAAVNSPAPTTQPSAATPEAPATTTPPPPTPPADAAASPATPPPAKAPAAAPPAENNPPPAPATGAGTPPSPAPAPDNKVPADLNK